MKCLLKTLSMVVFLTSVQCSVIVTGIKGTINYDTKVPDPMPTNSCLVKRLIHSIDGKQDVLETKVQDTPSKLIHNTYEFPFEKPDMMEKHEDYLVQIVLNVGWCSEDGVTNKSKDFTSGRAYRNCVILDGKIENAKIVGPLVKLRPGIVSFIMIFFLSLQVLVLVLGENTINLLTFYQGKSFLNNNPPRLTTFPGVFYYI